MALVEGPPPDRLISPIERGYVRGGLRGRQIPIESFGAFYMLEPCYRICRHWVDPRFYLIDQCGCSRTVKHRLLFASIGVGGFWHVFHLKDLPPRVRGLKRLLRALRLK